MAEQKKASEPGETIGLLEKKVSDLPSIFS